MLTVMAVVLATLASPAAAAIPALVHKFNASSFLVTMHALDPQSNNIDLLSAMSGSGVAGFTQYNYNSDISYGPYAWGYLVSGIQGGDVAAFADLGTSADLVGKDDCETVPGGQYFSSLHVSEGQIVVVDTCASSNACPHTYRNISGLKEKLGRVTSSAKVAPIPGHIYILNIVDSDTMQTRALFKLLVIDVGHGNTSVTFRYSVMNHNMDGIVECCDEENRNVCAPAPRNLVLEQGPPGTRGPASAVIQPSAAPSPSPSDNGVTGGQLVGAAVGSAAVSLMAVGGFWWCMAGRRVGSEDDAKRRLVSSA